MGAAITASTSGNIGTFLITARDTFGNRRPGGDTVSSIMRYWSTVNNSEADTSQLPKTGVSAALLLTVADASPLLRVVCRSLVLPKTGSIIDNKDGSYAVSYRITRAGIYVVGGSCVLAWRVMCVGG